MSFTLRFLSVALVLGISLPLHAENDSSDPVLVIRRFEKAWAAPKGYMRPLDDAGWKARMTAFRDLALAREKATTALIEALSKGESETPVFAAQALSWMADPKARPALEAALKDKTPAVRMYAVDALSMFGKLTPTEEWMAIKEKDANRAVKAHVGFALNRDDKPDPAALRQKLAGFDLAQMNTAVVGKAAPEFELTDATGKIFKLADFKGQKAVVLVFVDGDT